MGGLIFLAVFSLKWIIFHYFALKIQGGISMISLIKFCTIGVISGIIFLGIGKFLDRNTLISSEPVSAIGFIQIAFGLSSGIGCFGIFLFQQLCSLFAAHS